MKVEFPSHGQTVVGDLHLPEGKPPLGSIVLLGPLTSVKEQATGNYAAALAKRGWAALSFDPRYFGESGGQPRQYENPTAKIEDVVAAVDYLQTRADLASKPQLAVGVCAGAGYMAGAVAREPRLRAFGAVAGFFHDAEQQRQWSGAGFEQALERARAARHRWETTGDAETIPAVGKEGDVAMPLAEAFEYYGTSRGGSLGGYVNAFAVMSREHTLVYDSQSAAREIRVPVTLVHSENALSPSLARAFFEKLGGDKHLEWLSSTGQIDFYDDPNLIEAAVAVLDASFRKQVS